MLTNPRLWLVLAIVPAMCFAAGCGTESPGSNEEDPPDQHTYGSLTGTIRDAMTGDGIAGADVSAGGDYAVTDGDGHFTLDHVRTGSVVVDVACEGYVALESSVTIEEGQSLEQDFALVPESEVEEYRIVLTWGQNPGDLDSHLWVPTGGETYWHVYYATDGHLDNVPYAALDTDDTSSYGPETITIRMNGEDFYEGEYVYAVHHYSGTGTLESSGATVRIYSGNELALTITAPGGCQPTDRYWDVGTLNARTGEWTTVNMYGSAPPLGYSLIGK